MNLNEIYSIAERDHVEICDVECPECLSISMIGESGDCYIGIDDHAIRSESERLVQIAHELGHCETGSFYTKNTGLDLIGKHEYRADKWAVLRLIPYEKLMEAGKRGISEIWEIAEYFGVTEDFVRRAREIYQNMGYSFS
ncbi:MAG: ImmA/IrrE family metallo-endopeptidase [Bacteroides sp.]|nr:ImmA/IrrE family metallo-endopeptidase [Eubacterium sp.]MCM1419379.1 ImmA/IrrE family metallo-endopeptidase [Roseburia sp.]MCM1463201.1 ImmA/IrrE family metallo-endopeptidase [Bacteroides sp.]